MAVMLADVVGYSRMMSRSEDATHARLSDYTSTLIEPCIAKHEGHLVRMMGDGLLVWFPSAVEAVRCALEIQRGFAERQADEPNPIRLRIGINAGDVMVDHRDIYGHSVNLAARIESLAAPGTVCVSQGIYDQLRTQSEFFFAGRGAHRVKNIPFRIQVFQVAHEPIPSGPLKWIAARWGRMAIGPVIGAIAIASTASALMVREQSRDIPRTNKIVVLPFKNDNGGYEDEYLADAITDDLTSELSRLARAWVISSGTAFNYKNKQSDPREVGRELKVRFALEGSVRRSGTIVQVNARLIDTANATSLSVNSFAYEGSSLVDLQDRMLGQLATAMNDQVIRVGYRHEVGMLTADHNPLDERMRAMAAMTGHPTPEKFLEARRNAEAGLKADPDNARLHGLLAHTLVGDVLNSWNGAGPAEVDRAEAAARRAIALDANTTLAHFALGYVYRLRGDHKASLESYNKAISIDPNFARGYAQAANAMVFLGREKEALPLVEKALQLSPNDPAIGVFYWVKGRAHFALRDYPSAVAALEQSVALRPNLWYTQAWLVAAHALTNADASAAAARDTFTASFSQFDLDRITRYYQEEQFKNPTLQAASAEMLKGLRKAGLK
ncbi:adenylate/guanylate cyclase domain-containing protein [Bradyrhizobium sp. HKCCYLRH3095]|uniref:adenylate/guanylate cyclase domain-containing protein n=2 Tax=unclassified Bradyrhizobium TaxID=2631580 RepID=UPI003EB6EDE6